MDQQDFRLCFDPDLSATVQWPIWSIYNSTRAGNHYLMGVVIPLPTLHSDYWVFCSFFSILLYLMLVHMNSYHLLPITKAASRIRTHAALSRSVYSFFRKYKAMFRLFSNIATLIESWLSPWDTSTPNLFISDTFFWLIAICSSVIPSSRDR